MHNLLVYGDSLSWGIIPDSRNRFRFDERWPGILELELNQQGCHSRIIEDCLNGRRTIWDDPVKAGRKGSEGLAQRIEVNSPLDLVILFLGTNDFQIMHRNRAEDSAAGIAELIKVIRSSPIEPTMTHPEILVVAPPAIQKARGTIAEKFIAAENKATGLNLAFQATASEHACHFFDAGSVTRTSHVDGVHLDMDQHATLGLALSSIVRNILESNTASRTDPG